MFVFFLLLRTCRIEFCLMDSVAQNSRQAGAFSLNLKTQILAVVVFLGCDSLLHQYLERSIFLSTMGGGGRGQEWGVILPGDQKLGTEA